MNTRYDFVVFSDDWGRHPSSCQHLMARLGQRHRVLWVNTIGMRAPKADAFTLSRAFDKFRQWRAPLWQVSDNFHVYAPAMLPAAGGLSGKLNIASVARRLRRVIARCGMQHPILFVSVPTGADYIGRLNERALAYYITDDYRLWPGANSAAIAAQDERLTRLADLVLPVGEELSANRSVRGQMELLPHAVDLEHFANAADAEEPEDIRHLKHPRLCFFGLVYEKVDLPLFARLARENPDKQVVLIGPVRTDVGELSRLPNVSLLGQKPYAELPRYLRHMDVLMLAYRLDEQTRRNAPLKIRECLACGKPTVAIDVPDLHRYADLIYLADDAKSFIDACNKACAEPKAAPQAMRAAVAGESWEARARQVEDALDRVLLGVAAPSVALTHTEACVDGADWDEYVTRHADGCIWHRWGWSQVMRWAYGLSCHFLLARREGKVVGALPLALQASRAFGRHLISLPWLDYSGILADDARARQCLRRHAESLAQRLGADLVLRESAGQIVESRLERSDQLRTDKVAMALDLPASPEALWDSFKAKVRNQIRKGEKSDLTAEWAGRERLQDFYGVYLTNMRDLGSPPHSLAFFRQVMRSFGDSCRLALVQLEGKVVAAALVLTDAPAWQVPWASSLRKYNSLCPSHVLYWHILREACGKTPRFCFGRSSRGGGTYKFKAQWGAYEQPLYWHTFNADAPAPRPAEAAPRPGALVAMVQRLWQHIPTSLARTLGPMIIKHVG